MKQFCLSLALLSLTTPAFAADPAPAPALAPGEIVAAAPKAEWVAIPASDLLVMDLAPDANGKPRRVTIQLMPPPFSQGWIGNIRKLAAAHWWDGLSVNRVQDNYVVQWGDADGEDQAKARALPVGLAKVDQEYYRIEIFDLALKSKGPTLYDPWTRPGTLDKPRPTKPPQSIDEAAAALDRHIGALGEAIALGRLGDSYAPFVGFAGSFAIGWAFGADREEPTAWPIHCYGMVGVGRNLSPDTGSGAELYTVIGHAPRHLDRNIALVGRVIEGIEHLSSLPRGTGALGFYETPEERTNILSIRLGNEVASLPAYEYLSTTSETFARYADARANRRDPFFITPAGGADICNIPVPVRRVK